MSALIFAKINKNNSKKKQWIILGFVVLTVYVLAKTMWISLTALVWGFQTYMIVTVCVCLRTRVHVLVHTRHLPQSLHANELSSATINQQWPAVSDQSFPPFLCVNHVSEASLSFLFSSAVSLLIISKLLEDPHLLAECRQRGWVS